MQTFLAAAAAFVVTVLSGLLLDFLRNARPKVSYFVKEAVPIDLGDHKCVGAYLVSVVNKSSRVVRELTCHLEANVAKLRNGGIAAPQGMHFEVEEINASLKVSIPYLKPAERIEMTVVAEGLYIPKKPEVAIRSPHNIKVVAEGSERQSSLVFRFMIAGAVAAAVVAITPLAVVGLRFARSQRDILTFAASVSGLPKLAVLYATSPESLQFYNQGDLAYALAASASDRSEIAKYQRLLSVTLDAPSGMAAVSRANLYYSLGKIDLFLGDRDKAVRDFREAINQGKAMVEEKSGQDSTVHDFLVSNALN
jgi:hypothetical protein